MPRRRRRLQRLHQPQELQQPRRRLPHLPGPRHRPRRQHRPHRHLHLDDRHGRPDTTISTKPANPTNSTAATFTFASPDGGSTFACRARRRRVQRLHQPQELQRPRRRLPHLPSPRHRPGRQHRPHPRHVHLDDRHDTADQTRSPRACPIPANATTATFTFSSGEPGSTFACRARRRAASRACTSPKSYTASPHGSHTFQVRATDAAGNTDPIPPPPTGRSTRRPPGSRSPQPATGTTTKGPTPTFAGAGRHRRRRRGKRARQGLRGRHRHRHPVQTLTATPNGAGAYTDRASPRSPTAPTPPKPSNQTPPTTPAPARDHLQRRGTATAPPYRVRQAGRVLAAG